jgi:hypothetical protein
LVSNTWQLALNPKKHKRIYENMKKTYLIPNTTFVISSATLTKNIGIRKFILETVKPKVLRATARNCDFDVVFKRTP